MALRRSVVAVVVTSWLVGLTVLLPGTAKATKATSGKPTVVDVTAGKPTEFSFELSRWSALPVGAISFVIKNEGTANHDFVLCQTPVSNAAQNFCLGYQSQDLESGQATTITIRGISKGIYEFLSTDPGDAAAGMKGLIGVGVPVKRPVVKPRPVVEPKPTVPTPVSTVPPLPPTGIATPATVTTTTTPAATTTASPAGGYICKQGGVIQGVSTPQLC